MSETPNRLLTVNPWYSRARAFETVARWGVGAIYVDVTEQWIHTVTAIWSAGDAIPVWFWYRGRWRSGNGFITHANVGAAMWSTAMSLEIEIQGTGRLK